jgi:hypothetical protein
MVHFIAAEKFHNGPYEKVKIVIIKIRNADIVALRSSKAAFPISNGHLGNSSARPRDDIFFIISSVLDSKLISQLGSGVRCDFQLYKIKKDENSSLRFLSRSFLPILGFAHNSYFSYVTLSR